MKEKLRFRKLSLLIVLLLITSFLAQAQMKSLSGIITDNTGSPLPGVTVSIKGTAQGTISDADGQYNLSVATGADILVFSYIGMKTLELSPGSKTVINVVMEEETVGLDEIVVSVGYGTQKKRDVTGAITSVDQKAIEQRQAVDVFDALQGAAAGVQISSVSGAPGAANNIQIRGASTFDDAGVSPLYVVDNVIVEDIDNINPGDIKSIEILKDAASSAIYGARSANGVIIITTKSGEIGTPRIDVRFLKSFSSISNKIPQVNAFERILNEASTRGPVLEKYKTNNDSVGLVNSTNYFYQDLLTRTAVRNDVNLGISGGTDKLKYIASIGYIGDEGVILTSYNNKFTGRFNVDFQVSKKLKSMSRMSFSNSKTNSINEGGVFQTAMRRPPNMIIYYPDGSYAPYYDMGGNKNPVQELTARDNLDDRYQATLYQALEFKFTKSLTFQTSATANFDLRRETEFVSKELDSNADENLRKNSGSDHTTWGQVYQGDAFLSFLQTFNNHTVNAMVGSSVETGKSEYLNFDGSYYVTESIHTMNMASILVAGTTAADYAIAGFFGRLGYNYKGKYLFNSNVRYDGSSRFGQNQRWGLFPSASLGWRFSDEGFMRWSKSLLTDGKFRASWGVTGNDRVGNYESLTRYTSGTYVYDGLSGVVPLSTYGNPNLHWEETRQTNFGVDLSFLDGRANFTADYYIKETSDLLSNLNLPYTTGYSTMRVNLASIENKGLEFSLSGYPVSTKSFEWHTTINWWNNKNTITELAREDYIQSSYYYIAKGQPAGLFYGYRNQGIYEYDLSNAYTEDYKTRLTPVMERDNNGNVIIGLNGQPNLQHYTLPDGTKYEGAISKLSAGGVVAGGGDVIWENKADANGTLDDKIDDNDRSVLGQATPDWYASWSNNVSYKNFTLSFNFYTSWGGLVYNKLKRYYSSWGGNTHMQLPEYVRTGWIYQGQITNWYAVNTRDRKTINRAELSDFFLEDATFVRLRNLRLSYNVDNKYLKSSFVKGCMVYVYGNNLLTWTNYTGYDPEVGGGVLTPGTDNQAYPRNREIGFGLNVNF